MMAIRSAGRLLHQIAGFNMYDPIALLAAVPSLAATYFDCSVLEVEGVSHRVVGVSKVLP